MAGHDITVSVAFTATQMDQVRQAQDVRLALAARSVTDGQVTQFLAGAPELLARYRNAPPAARTLIEAAMDARRLGTGAALSQQFLEAAAPGYLTEDEWDALGDDWLEQALAYTAIPCKGARGPLTRIRPRPARPRPSAAATRAHSGPSYRLADYLEQTGRRDRAEITPPISFWEAIASFSEPADLPDLARSALSRGLFRHAAHIYKRAARYDADAAWDLLRLIGRIDPGSTPEAGLWIAHHGALTDVFDLTRLLAALHGERLGTAVTLLAARAAKDAPLDDPERSSELIDAMLEVDAADAAVDTSDRAARTAGVTIPYHVAALLDSLRSTGNHDALNHLARRVITAPAITGYDRARLIAAMSWADNHMVITLADRIAAEIDPPGTDDVTKILVMMHRAGAYHARSLLLQRVLAAGKDLVGTKAGGELRWALRDPHAREAVAALAGEIAQQSDLADATSAAALLRLLWEAGADEIAADIAMRMAGLVQLDDIRTAAHLIRLLHRHGARQAADHLIGQDLISRISVSDPGAVASLLDALHTAGAADSVAAVMRLDPAARAEITDMSEVASLLQALRQTGNIDAANALAVRAADELNANFDGLSDDQMHGALACVLPRLRESQVAHQETDQLCHALVERLDTSDVYKLARLSRVLRDAGEADAVDHLAQRAAGDVDLTDTGRLAFWLSLVTLELRADPAFDSALLNRDPAAYADLTDPKLVADLIVAFNRQGRADAVATLLARDLAGHVDLTRTSEVETLLQVLLRAGAIDAIDVLLNADLVGRADLSNPPVVIELLRTLRAVGAEQAVTALLACLPADYFEITDPDAIDSQLTGLLEIGDADATQKFLAQDPAGNADLTEQPYRLQSINTMQARIGIAGLVATLHKAGADDQATKLADRAANIGKFDLQLNRERFPYGREADGQPSTQWSWHELE
jgi:hypothetical protein